MTISFNSPVFGTVVLVLQPVPDDDSLVIGYLGGDKVSALKQVMRLDGRWRYTNGKTITAAPTEYYRMEKPDGSPLF